MAAVHHDQGAAAGQDAAAAGFKGQNTAKNHYDAHKNTRELEDDAFEPPEQTVDPNDPAKTSVPGRPPAIRERRVQGASPHAASRSTRAYLRHNSDRRIWSLISHITETDRMWATPQRDRRTRRGEQSTTTLCGSQPRRKPTRPASGRLREDVLRVISDPMRTVTAPYARSAQDARKRGRSYCMAGREASRLKILRCASASTDPTRSSRQAATWANPRTCHRL